MALRKDCVDRKQRRPAAAILLTGFLWTALVLAQDRVGAYDFAYRLAGDARAKPVQVFDDGRDTFFQFRPGEPVPAIFAEGTAGPRLLPPQSEGPYVKVATVTNGFALRLGLGAATVTYLGVPRVRDPAAPVLPDPARRMHPPPSSPSSPPPLQLAASLPVSGLPRELLAPMTRPRITLEEGSYSTPLKGDAIEWTATPEKVRLIEVAFGKDSAVLTAAAAKQLRALVAEARPSSRFELTAVDDAANKQGLASARVRAVEAALLAVGAAARNIVQKTAVNGGGEAGANPGTGVSLRLVDATTSAMQSQSSLLRPQQARTPPSVAETVFPAAAPAAPPAPQVWAVREADGTLDKMLARWAKEAGWTLVWQNGPAVAITGDASLSRSDYIQAADYALEQARVAGYRLRATAYSNLVLVVTSEE